MYLNGFTYSTENARLLYRAILWAARREALADQLLPDSVDCECSYYPASNRLVVINNSDAWVHTRLNAPWGARELDLAPQGIAIEEE